MPAPRKPKYVPDFDDDMTDTFFAQVYKNYRERLQGDKQPPKPAEGPKVMQSGRVSRICRPRKRHF